MIFRKKKSLKKSFALGIASAIICGMLFLQGGFVTSAAAYNGGSGTKKDPYLLKTAADVDNIRNNLSAHFKLAATIDMSSIKNFEPIGCFDEFKGSLTCDLGADGIPKYAILNLHVYNSTGKDFGYDFASPNYAGYGEPGIHYYASLFGKTKGAKISNIYLLNVNIENTVVGQHQGVGGYDTGVQTNCAKQVDDQGSAALVTFAYGTSISNCGAQGKINAKTNATAGLVARLCDGSSLSNSWADCEINGEGFWYQAGLVGTVTSSTVDSCYSKGTIYCPCNKPYTSRGIGASGSCGGGLVGYISKDSIVTNSYTETSFKSGSVVRGTFVAQSEGTIKNCYASGKDESISNVVSGNSTTNCWVLNAAGSNQQEFSAGTAAQIKQAFSSVSAFDCSGELPKLRKIKYLTDYSIFVAGAERAGAGTANAAQTDSSDGASDGGTQTDNTDITDDGSNQTVTDNSDNSANTVSSSFVNTPAYIILFVGISAVIVAISAFSFIMLMKAVNTKKKSKIKSEIASEVK